MIEVKPVQVSEVKTETTIDLNCFKTCILVVSMSRWDPNLEPSIQNLISGFNICLFGSVTRLERTS